MNRWRNIAALFVSVLAGAAFAGNGCPANMSNSTPAGSANPNTAVADGTGPQGPPGPQGPAGPQGAPGTNATVTAGTGILVTNGQVSLNSAVTDGFYWKQDGNAGTDPATKFLGTTDNKPMELRVNNFRALRLEPAARDIVGQPGYSYQSSNFIAGYSGNTAGAGVVGATVHGGGLFVQPGNVLTPLNNQVVSDFGAIGGGYSNTVQGTADTIGGGNGNSAGSDKSTVGGGESNSASGSHSFIGGGNLNEATSLSATIGGGDTNHAMGSFATVGGGQGNIAGGIGIVGATVGGGIGNEASGPYSVVPGGQQCIASGANSFAAGYKTQVAHSGSFVWADPGRTGPTLSQQDNEFMVVASSGVRLIRTDDANGVNTTQSNAAVQVEKLNANGEALWIWQRLAQPATVPVIKLHRNATATNNNNFMEGLDWNGPPNAATGKFHIDKNGSFVAGSDFAEALPARDGKKNFEPGDVVIFSVEKSGMVEKCRAANDTKVAGVYSTRPGVIGADKNGQTRVDAEDIPVAITGIVPTKVSCENGPIHAGDLLTTAQTPGHAMRAKAVKIGDAEIYATGTIIGKAIESLTKGTGKIRVLVTLR